MSHDHLRTVSREKVPRRDWDEVAQHSSRAWLWHRSDAIDAYASWENASDRSFAILDSSDAGRIVAITPLYAFNIGRPFTCRLESTGGPATADNLSARQQRNVEHAIQDSLRNIANSTGARSIELSLPPLAPALRAGNATNLNPLMLVGCQDMSTASWVVDLRDSSEADLWRRLEARVRKAVNKARAAGITVSRATPDELDAYYALHIENCRRNGIPPKPKAYFSAIFRTFLPQEQARIFAASDASGQRIAFHVFAICKSAALYWTTCSADHALLNGANDLIQWTAMQDFLTSGIELYETGEAFPAAEDSKLRRISDFKKGFGGKLMPYFRGRIVTRPIIHAGMDFMRAIRNATRTLNHAD